MILGGGKWQRRIIETLREAGRPLTTRQLRIRCGMMPSMDTTGSAMRNALCTIVDARYIARIRNGLFTIRNI